MGPSLERGSIGHHNKSGSRLWLKNFQRPIEMPRGGKRRGAGRKPGSKNNKSPRLLSDDIDVVSGEADAAVALRDLMRKIAHNPNVDVQLRLEAAKAVAPYLLPRLSTISSSVDGVDDVFEVRGPNPIYIIPRRCFLTQEQMRNPDALIENAVPFVLDEIAEENIPPAVADVAPPSRRVPKATVTVIKKADGAA